jgi:hypothetical protein
MPLPDPLNPGTIFWTGENPGIMLKERDDGPWSALALFFRIAWSPAGQGHALLLLERPELAKSLPDAANVIMGDNEPLTRLLMTEFVGKLGAFSDPPGFKAAKRLAISEARAGGDPSSRYSERVTGGGLDVELVWDGLGRPTALELPPPLTGTKAHTMFSLLVESRDPAILVNGRRLPGKPVPRVQAGIQTTSAFLYFAETWISSPAGAP